MSLRDLARDQACVRCSKQDGSTVLAHYTGPRRHAYGGGFGIKCHDSIGAWLCGVCHKWMDTESRDKSAKWEHSEEFLHLVALTVRRMWELGLVRIV
jgi:transcription elongation factor Elf1